jgi:hypothetical protein
MCRHSGNGGADSAVRQLALTPAKRADRLDGAGMRVAPGARKVRIDAARRRNSRFRDQSYDRVGVTIDAQSVGALRRQIISAARAITLRTLKAAANE